MKALRSRLLATAATAQEPLFDLDGNGSARNELLTLLSKISRSKRTVRSLPEEIAFVISLAPQDASASGQQPQLVIDVARKDSSPLHFYDWLRLRSYKD